MKTVKTIFAILFLSTMFIACEADAVNDGVEISEEVEDGQTDPVGEVEDEQTNPND